MKIVIKIKLNYLILNFYEKKKLFYGIFRIYLFFINKSVIRRVYRYNLTRIRK